MSGGGKRKIDESIVDFAVKQGDPPVVATILQADFVDWDDYMTKLSGEAFDALQKFTVKQRNIERVTEFIIANEPNLKTLKDLRVSQ